MNVTRNQKVIAASTILLLVGAGFVIANNASRKPFTGKPPVNVSADAKNAAVQTQAGAFLLNADAALAEADALCATYWKEKGSKTLPESKAFFLRKGNVDTGPIQGSWVCGPSIRGGSLLGGFEAGSWVVTQTDKGLTFAAKDIAQFNTTLPVGYLTWRPDGKTAGDPNKLNVSLAPAGTVIPPSSLLDGRVVNDSLLGRAGVTTTGQPLAPDNSAPITAGPLTVQQFYTSDVVLGEKDQKPIAAPADKVFYRIVYTNTITDPPAGFTVNGQPIYVPLEDQSSGQGVWTATLLAGKSEAVGMTEGKNQIPDLRAAAVTLMFLDPEIMPAGASVPASSMAAKSAVAAAQTWADAIGGGDLGRAIAIMDLRSVGAMFDYTGNDGPAGLTSRLSWGGFGEQGLRPGQPTKDFIYTGYGSCTNSEARSTLGECYMDITTKLGTVNLYITTIQTGAHEFRYQIGVLHNQKGK